MDEISYVNLDRLISIVDELKEKEIDKIPMEFIISAFFPDAYDNLKNMITQSYMDGFKAGIKSVSEDDGK